LEIRQFAEAIRFYVERWVPDAYEAFKDYRLDSVFLTGPEILYLQNPEHKLKGREKKELEAKLKILMPETWRDYESSRTD
jgi:thymidylate synthase ThyX